VASSGPPTPSSGTVSATVLGCPSGRTESRRAWRAERSAHDEQLCCIRRGPACADIPYEEIISTRTRLMRRSENVRPGSRSGSQSLVNGTLVTGQGGCRAPQSLRDRFLRSGNKRQAVPDSISCDFSSTNSER
jgi:hypothetical protein